MNILPFDHDVEVTKNSDYSYQIFTMWSKDSTATTAQGLLNLAAWVEQHHTQLEQEASTIGKQEDNG